IEEEEKSDLKLTVAGTKDAVNMVEAEADEVEEAVVLEAIMFAHEEIKRLVTFQEEIIQAVGDIKREITVFEIEQERLEKIEAQYKDELTQAIQVEEKHAREEAMEAVKDSIIEPYENLDDEEQLKQAKDIVDHMVKEEVGRHITEEKIYPNGTIIDKIHPLSSRETEL